MDQLEPRLSNEELELLNELLAAERDRLLVEIRHADHRNYREQLRHRLALVESLAEKGATAAAP
jgi:hypothetical protein